MEPKRLNRIPRASATPVGSPRALLVILILSLSASGAAIALVACGGGGDDKADKTPTPGVDCKANPEACK